jgi:hypothetical protein
MFAIKTLLATWLKFVGLHISLEAAVFSRVF